MDIVIRPSDGDWTSVDDPSEKITNWEAETGSELPADYRRFIFAFNGGRIYPLIFDRAIPSDAYATGEPATFVNSFYPWEMVERIWKGDIFGGRLPPDMLVIGSSPGGIEILLSVNLETFGQIYLWLHSQSGWGDDGNDRVWLQATSFRSFIETLYENDDEEGYDYWYLPSKKGLEKKVEL